MAPNPSPSGHLKTEDKARQHSWVPEQRSGASCLADGFLEMMQL